MLINKKNKKRILVLSLLIFAPFAHAAIPPGYSVIDTIGYEYDAEGNRISRSATVSGVPETPLEAQYDAGNRLTQLTLKGQGQNGTDLSCTLSYDLNGNLAGKSCTDPANTTPVTTQYTWDSRNRLIQIQSPSVTASFQYDPLGRRIELTVNGQATQYLYDGNQAIAELNGNTVSASYLTGLAIDEVIARYTTEGERTLLTDALGSVLVAAKEDTSVATAYGYSAYGETQIMGTDEQNPVQYTSRENDGTGLYYYRARYYDPQFKRFISEDPISIEGGINVYAYVEGNPISYIDPMGLLKYNKPSPITVPPSGNTLNALRCLEACLQRNTDNPCLDLLVTGGAERSGHSRNSHHYRGEAVDIAGPGSNPVSNPDVMDCASRCGFGAGHYEQFSNNPNRNHWHLQMTPGNGVPALPSPARE